MDDAQNVRKVMLFTLGTGAILIAEMKGSPVWAGLGIAAQFLAIVWTWF